MVRRGGNPVELDLHRGSRFATAGHPIDGNDDDDHRQLPLTLLRVWLTPDSGK